MEIVPQPLTREAFAAFGDVIDVPSEAGRTYYEEALGNLRPGARPSLSVSLKAETVERPLKAELLERHEFSSQSLGASWLYTLRRVTLPLIAPGIAAGAFLAFMASIDNVPVSLFLSNARTDTLPIRMWGMMESTLDVRVAAVSGVLITAAFLLMLLMEWTVGLTRRMRD